jgi:diguanylate cyclase (GGDEF)-like protein
MDDFTSASRRALQFLHEQFGLGLWMVTRVEGDNWIVLSADDSRYGVEAGAVLKWSDSFCARMVDGSGPQLARDAALVAAYRDAPIGKRMTIGCYVGIPLKRADGSLFGTLCAIDPESQPPELEKHFPYIELIAELLSDLLNVELKAVEATRRFEREFDAARTDFLTSLYNRRGWTSFLDREEDRCRRYGHPAAIISIDLDDLKRINDRYGHTSGDEILNAAARAIAGAVRPSDIVARTGGDEFAVLCVECAAPVAREIEHRIRLALAERNISASLSMEMRAPAGDLHATAELADRAMYREKSAKKRDAVQQVRRMANAHVK